jgi:hypothetical protein
MKMSGPLMLAGVGLIAALVFQVGCTIQAPNTQNPQGATQAKAGSGSDKDANPEGADAVTNPDDIQTDDGNGENPSSNTTTPSDTSAVVGVHWSTPSCPGSVCYDTLLNEDGTYQKQRILINLSGQPTLFCEHGTWTATGGTISFDDVCRGNKYEQTWSHSNGSLELQGVTYSSESTGVFNCAATEC